MTYSDLLLNQKSFYKSQKTKPLDFRLKMLDQLKQSILKYEEDIAKALHQDLGKSVGEVITTEIGFTLNEIKNVKRHLKKWQKPKRVKTNSFNLPSRSVIVSEPYGQVLIIGPWNYPFQLAMSPLIGAIAGGNTAIVKPSEMAENTARVIEKVLTDAFSTEYIATVTGGIPETTALLDNRFDKIFFTGSPKVGSIIMAQAAKHLTPVVLELGGKSPVIIHEDAPLDLAIKRVVFGKGTNAGQTCVAPDYILVHESKKAAFVEGFKRVVKDFYGENPVNNPDYGKMINQANYKRVKDYLTDGALLSGGTYDDMSLKIEPSLIEPKCLAAPVMTEEIFGPVLPLITYSNVEEVVNIIDRNPDPLALYIFSKNKGFIDHLINRVHFGGGCINDTTMHLTNEHLPFGGRGTSGHGAYHGYHSFKVFTHEKSILKGSTLFDLKLKYPPHQKNVLKLIKKIMY